jgi:hypothetical protein
MRKLFLLTIIASVIISCKKDNSISNNLTGSWEYRGTACFCVPPADTNAHKPGNGNLLNFTGGSYKRYAKNVLQKSGTVTISTVVTGTVTRNKLIFDGDTVRFPPYFKIEGTKLTFYGDIPAAADGVEVYYEKIK